MDLLQRLHKGLLIVLKHTLNPVTCRIARSSHGPFTLVRHVGRRSGQRYETPIILRLLNRKHFEKMKIQHAR